MQARVSQLALKPGETSQEVQIRGNREASQKIHLLQKLEESKLCY